MNTQYNFDPIKHRNAIDFLKGIIVSYSKKNGMKHSSKKEVDGFFKNGCDFYKKSYLNHPMYVTYIHIIYNRLRHTRPHKLDFKNDQEFLKNLRCYYAISLFHENLENILGKEELAILEGF